MTHDGVTKMNLHEVKGKSSHICSEVEGALLLLILFTLYTTFKSHIKYRGKGKVSFWDGKSSYCEL
jgi:hypothetical protein